MLGEQTIQPRTTYLNIKNGSVVRRERNGQESCFSYVSGSLKGISKRNREFRGERVIYWYIDLLDRKTNEAYSIGFPYSSNTFKSVVMSLASASTFTNIRIKPYLANGFEKVVVYADEVKLDWVVKSLPPIKEVTIGGKVVKDDTERMAVIEEYVRGILTKVAERENR